MRNPFEAPQSPSPPPAPFPVGEVLGEGFRLGARYAPVVLIAAALPSVPSVFLPAATVTDPLFPWLMISSAMLGTIATSLLLRWIHRSETGAAVPLAPAILDAVTLLGPLLVYQGGIGLGLVAGVVPGLVLLTRWSAAWPVLVLERRGTRRAAALSSGRRWPLAAVTLGAWCAAGCGVAIGAAVDQVIPSAPPLFDVWMGLCLQVPILVSYAAWRRLLPPE